MASKRRAREERMRTTTTHTAITSRVWRDLGRLAVEALAIGLLSSLLLALAVLVMSRGRPDDRYAGAVAPASRAQAQPPASGAG